MLHGRRFTRRSVRPASRNQRVVSLDVGINRGLGGPGTAGTGRGPGRGRMVFTPPTGINAPRRPVRQRHPLHQPFRLNLFHKHTHGY